MCISPGPYSDLHLMTHCLKALCSCWPKQENRVLVEMTHSVVKITVKIRMAKIVRYEKSIYRKNLRN